MIGLVVAVVLLGPEPRPAPQPGWDEEPAPAESVPDPVAPEVSAPAPDRTAPPDPAAAPATPPTPTGHAPLPPAAPPANPAEKLEHRRTLALRGAIVGYVGFGIAYVTSASIGAVYLSDAERLYPHDPERGRAFGRRMLIPLAGPFLAIDPAKTSFGRIGAATLGVVQIASLAGAVIGTTRYVTLGKDRARIRVGMRPVPDGGGVLVTGRF